MENKPGLIYAKMAAIMADIDPIAKSKTNTQQNYKFRGIDEIYQGVQQVMARHGVFSIPQVIEDRSETHTSKSGSVLIYRILKINYPFYAEDGSSVVVTVIGEGMDSGDKASNKAMSSAEKYALLQAFKIPTAEPKDSENDSHEVNSKMATQLKAAAQSRTIVPLPPDNNDIPPPTDEHEPNAPENRDESAGNYIITFGKYKGKSIADVGIPSVVSYLAWVQSTAKKTGKPMSQDAQELYLYSKAYAEGKSVQEVEMEGLPI